MNPQTARHWCYPTPRYSIDVEGTRDMVSRHCRDQHLPDSADILQDSRSEFAKWFGSFRPTRLLMTISMLLKFYIDAPNPP
jgi:hypothetical protein